MQAVRSEPAKQRAW